MKRRKDLLAYTYSDKRYRIGAHLLFWVLLFGGNYYFNSISFNAVSGTPAAYLFAIKNTVVTAAAFYPLVYFILPWFARRKPWFIGVFFILVWILLISLIDSWGDQRIYSNCARCAERLAQTSPDYYRFLQRNLSDIVFTRVLSGGFLYMQIFVLSFPVAIKFARNYFRQTVQGLQLAKDNLQLEFNFLKAQVNPHFLFNTLNNIYALVEADRKEQATATIARLSGFMRYTLYETGAEKISLQKEVQLMKDYIELEQLRLNETEVLFRFNSDADDYTVPPLLFMPALENAFKYTVDKRGSRIVVDIKAVQGKLSICIQNSFDEQRTKGAGGIGLQNLQKRVHYYYGDNAEWSAGGADGVYLFTLNASLK